MKVVILCGGKGTRLREETEYRPKPMLPIGNRPILWHIMQRYARYGHKEFVLCLGYKGEMIRSFFRDIQWNTSDVTLSLAHPNESEFPRDSAFEDWKVTLCDTGLESGTAWRLRSVKAHLRDKPFLLTYGDGVGNIDLNALVAHHRRSRSICTLTAVHPPGRFGEVSFRSDGSVETFNEKPQTEAGFINGGFMACEPDIFDYLPEDSLMMFEQDPLRQLVAAGRLAGYRHEGFWQPMDTLQEFNLLNRLWTEGRAPWAE